MSKATVPALDELLSRYYPRDANGELYYDPEPARRKVLAFLDQVNPGYSGGPYRGLSYEVVQSKPQYVADNDPGDEDVHR